MFGKIYYVSYKTFFDVLYGPKILYNKSDTNKKRLFMKSIQHLIADTERIRQIIEQWNENQNIPAIERDIVLDKLKHLYEILLSETVIDFTGDTPQQSSCSVSSANEKTEINEAPIPVQTASSTECPVEENHSVNNIPDTPSVSETILGSVSRPEPIDPVGNIEQKLFEEDQIPRPKVDKQVILSLYGDDPTPTKNTFNHPVDPIQPVFRQTATSSPMEPPIRNVEPVMPASGFDSPHPTAAEAGSGSHKKVFGEMLSDNGSIPMNEALGKQNNHADVASKLQATSINGDLRQHIGINDRFMIIRNLFGGNSEAFNATMAQLNTFTDLDDALLYIQDHYSWNPDDESVKMIIDLLERKLG